MALAFGGADPVFARPFRYPSRWARTADISKRLRCRCIGSKRIQTAFKPPTCNGTVGDLIEFGRVKRSLICRGLRAPTYNNNYTVYYCIILAMFVLHYDVVPKSIIIVHYIPSYPDCANSQSVSTLSITPC